MPHAMTRSPTTEMSTMDTRLVSPWSPDPGTRSHGGRGEVAGGAVGAGVVAQLAAASSRGLGSSGQFTRPSQK